MTGAFEDKTIVVTGAAGGIGRAIAELLAPQGARLLLIDPNAEGARALADSLPGGPHTVSASYLETPAACQEALAAVEGPLYGLVHMAGIFEKHDLVPEARAVYDRTMAANLTNGFDLVTAALPRLIVGEPARMVFASSLAFRRGSLGRVAYSVAKGGVAGLVRALARNLGHKADRFTTVNLDFLRHYRPTVNVVERPTRKGGQGYSIVGHHEILVPLIAAGVVEALEARS